MEESESTHNIVAGIFGVYCSKCNSKVKTKGNSLYPPDQKTLRRHFKQHRCYTGPNPPNCYAVERELIRSQKGIQSAAKSNSQLAKRKIADIFPSGETKTYCAHVCLNCGYSSTESKVFKKHFGKRNAFGCLQSTDWSNGKIDVCSGRFDIVCPKHFLEDSLKGEFPSPNKRLRKSPPAAADISVANINPATIQRVVNPHPLTSFLPTFTTSPAQLQQAIDPSDTSPPKAINDRDRIDRALRCFVDQTTTDAGDASKKNFIDKHLALLTKVIDAMDTDADEEKYFRDLASKTSSTSRADDDPLLKLIDNAGCLWLKSGNANTDVRRISPGHRGRLFQVSESDAPDAETLVRGKTFVPSNDVNAIATEWSHFIHFIIRYNPNLIKDQLLEAKKIYNAKIEQNDKEKDAKKDAETKMMDTNIIFGIVLAAVHEKPPIANGLNSLDYFLAARAIIASANGRLKFKNGGGIGAYSLTTIASF